MEFYEIYDWAHFEYGFFRMEMINFAKIDFFEIIPKLP